MEPSFGIEEIEERFDVFLFNIVFAIKLFQATT